MSYSGFADGWSGGRGQSVKAIKEETREPEMPITTSECAVRVKVSLTTMSAIKRDMGLKGTRRMYFSQVVKWLKKNPGFRVRRKAI